MRAPRPLFALACLAASCGDPAALPLEVQAGDLVVVVRTKDGLSVADTVIAEAGEPIAVDADPDRPVYTWVVPRDAQVDATGAALSADSVTQTRVRFVEDAPIEGVGACGTCAAPTLAAPHVVHPGDSCPLPAFEVGAVWRPSGDGYQCASGRGGRLCTEGTAADHDEIEALRRRLRLDRPGDCACTTPPAPASLEGLEITPLAPVESPVPTAAYAENSAGQIAAFGRNGTLLFDGTTTHQRIAIGYEGGVRAATALRSGDFLVTGSLFNSGARDAQGYFRFSPTAEGLSDPVEISPSAPVLANKMRYFGDADDEFPLYLIGGIRDALGVDPAVYACTEDRLACRQVAFASCPRRENFTRYDDAHVDEAGFGLGVGKNALYYKRPSAGPDGITADDAWRCDQPEGPFDSPDAAEPPLSLDRFVSIGHAGSRHFVCAQEAVDQCESTRAFVLTATAGATDPAWRVTYVGPRNSYCGDFLPANRGARLAISGARLVEFDEDGAVTGTPSIFERYGSLDGYYGISPLAGDRVLARGSENRLFVATSSAAFVPIYGPAPRTRRAYEAAVARPGGGFFAFGNSAGPVSVSDRGLVQEGRDPSGALDAAYVYAAIRLGPATRDEVPVLLGGEAGGAPWLARAVVRGGDLADVRPIEVPAEAASVRYLAALGDRALVGTLDTHLFALVGDALETIPLAWDEPISEAVEVRPANPIDGCSGAPGRLNTWRALFAGDDVGWAVGTEGVVFQITPSADGLRGERFYVDPASYLSAGRATCPGDVWIGGRGDRIDPSGVTVTSVQLFEISEQDEPRRAETPDEPLDPRRYGAAPAAADQIATVNVLDITFGIPVAILPDTDGRPGSLDPTLVLNNGFLYRTAAGRRLEYLRVPFDPWFAAQDEAGTVLFGGGDGRLALGRPR